MPRKPKKPCAHPGCPELVETGTLYCEKHKPFHKGETQRPSSGSYGYRWQKARKLFLEAHPLCEQCAARSPPRYTRATVVDHIIPHRGDSRLFWDQSNWQALCKPCHDKKTGNEDTVVSYSYKKERTNYGKS